MLQKTFFLASAVITLTASLLFAQPIGEIYQAGTTWWDFPYYGGRNRQIAVDDSGYSHIVWTNSPEQGSSVRYVYYQQFDLLGNPQFPNGLPVYYLSSNSPNLVLDSENRVFIVMNSTQTYPFMPSGYGAGVLFEHYLAGFQQYNFLLLPAIGGVAGAYTYYPKIARDIDDRFHFLSYSLPAGLPGTMNLYYCRGHYDTTLQVAEFDTELANIGWSAVFGGDIACSPVSNRTAIGWLEPCASQGEIGQSDNNIIMCRSEDGVNWDWNDTLNITNWNMPDYSLLPDTASANKDTFRCYTDLALIFDYYDNLHVFFSTRNYFTIQSSMSRGNGAIWHWSEEYPYFSVVASGFYENDYFDPGEWNIYVQNPNPAIDSETGDIYCAYQRYFHPWSYQQNYLYMIGDSTGISAGGYLNGELWVTKSADNGHTWAVEIDITNTHTPGLLPGECESEVNPSMAEKISDGNCHISYLMDKDAGSFLFSEGCETFNDIIYHRVPIWQIPEAPILPSYPMHCDSMGMPQVTSVENPSVDIPNNYLTVDAYPNPFNNFTTIKFDLPEASDIKLAVYDITGRKVQDLGFGIWDLGKHNIVWNASGQASGVYFVRMDAGKLTSIKKIALMK